MTGTGKKTILFIAIILLAIFNAQGMSEPVQEPGFETIVNWVFTPAIGTDTGGQSGAWFTEGANSYKIERVEGATGFPSPSVSQANIDFTGIHYIKFDWRSVKPLGALNTWSEQMNINNTLLWVRAARAASEDTTGSATVNLGIPYGVSTLKFFLISDPPTSFYIDNITHIDNIVPTTPLITNPSNNSHIQNTVNATWETSTDSEGDSIIYEYHISTLPDFSDTIFNTTTSNNYTGSLALTNGQKYFVRVRAKDNFNGYSNWSTAYTENNQTAGNYNYSWINLTSNISASNASVTISKNLTGSNWWNTSWSTRIMNTIPDGLRPYQLRLNVSNGTGTNNATSVFCNGLCNSNYSDIRFVLNNTTLLSHWLETNSTNDTIGLVWVNVTANGTVSMYYGNNNVQNNSNGNATFPFFNNGSAYGVYVSQPFGYNISMRGLLNYVANSAWWSLSNNLADPRIGIYAWTAYNPDITYVPTDTAFSPSLNIPTGYRVFEIIRNGSTNVVTRLNDTNDQTHAKVTGNMYVEMGSTKPYHIWTMVRNYTYPELTWATWSNADTGTGTGLFWAAPEGGVNSSSISGAGTIYLNLTGKDTIKNVQVYASPNQTFNATLTVNSVMNTFTKIPLSNPSISESQIDTVGSNTISISGSDADGQLNSVQVGITYNGVETNYSMGNSSNTWTYVFRTGTAGTYTVSGFYANDTSMGNSTYSYSESFTVASVMAGGLIGGGGSGGGILAGLFNISSQLPEPGEITNINIKSLAQDPTGLMILWIILILGIVLVILGAASDKVTADAMFWGAAMIILSAYSQGWIN